MTKVSKRWTSHLTTDKEKKEFEAYLRENRLILDRLKDIVTKELVAIEAKTEGYDFYLLPGVSERQAYCKAQIKEKKTLLELLEV